MSDILKEVINAETNDISKVQTTDDTTVKSENIEPIQSKEELTKIYSGDALAEDEINDLLAKDLVRFVILSGLPSYGKTTLIASIFEHFLYYGQYCGYDFAGSSTLVGFDKRCYLSRLSFSSTPETKHTVLGDNYFLDLSLVNQKTNKRERLIIVDASGEAFQKFQKDNNAVKEFSSLLRADHFVYIFDASLLNDRIIKHDAKDAALMIIRSIKECDMFVPNVKIEIVFSKWDKVIKNADIDKFKESIKEEIKIICSDYELKDFIINSRDFRHSFELEKLFLYWMDNDYVLEYQNKIKKGSINWKDDYLKYLDYGREK